MPRHRLADSLHRAHLTPTSTSPVGLLLDKTTGFMFAYGKTVPSSAAGYAIGCLFCHTDGTSNTAMYVNEGSATSCTFTAITSGSDTLQTAFAAGSTITGAAAATKMTVGDGTDGLTFYATNASNMAYIGTAGSADLTLIPAGGDLIVTGTAAVSGTTTSTGDLTVGASKVVVTAASGATAWATGATLTLDTNKFTVSAAGAGVFASDLAVGGNITGTFAGTMSATTWTANPTITLSATTGNGVNVDGKTVTSGNILYINSDSSLTGASGNFINCYDSTAGASKLTVASNGAVTVAGTAAATALGLNAGDLEVSAGGVDILGGAVSTDLLDITRSNSATGGDAIDINMGTATVTGDAIDIAWGGAGTGDGVVVNMTNNVAGGALVLTGAGTRADALIDIVDVPNSGAETILITATAANNAGHVLSIVDTGAFSNSLINLAYTGNNATGDAITATMTAADVTAQAFVAVGKAAATAPLVQLTGSGVSGGECLKVTNTPTHGDADTIALVNAGTVAHNALAISYTAASIGDAINIVMTNAAATANAIDITGISCTVPLVNITSAGGDEGNAILITSTATHADGKVIEIVENGTAGNNIIDIAYGGANTGDALSVAMGTNVAGGALVITAAGARTDAIIDITDTSTSNSATIDIANTGVRTGGALKVAYSSAAATEDAITLTMGTNVAGRGIAVTSAATGATNEGAILDVAHTGDLAANADCVRIHSTGNISSTSALLSLFQETGAGTTGSVLLHLQADGASVEALTVASGKCSFAETCTFTDVAGSDAAFNITGFGAADGGTVVIAGGAASAGAGGLVSLTGGAGTAGAGGAATLAGGVGNGANAGGAVYVTGAAGGAAGAGGAVTIVGGAPASGTANGGLISITSGANGATAGNVGTVTIDTGAVAGGGTGAAISLGATNATGITLSNNAATVACLGPLTTTNGIASGTARVVGGRAYNITANATSTATASEELLGQYSIPASTLLAGSAIKVRFGLFVTNKNAADTLVVTLRMGPTTLTGTVLEQTTAHNVTTNDIVYGEFTFVPRAAPGATASCVGYGTICEPDASGAATTLPAAHRLAPTDFATSSELLLEITTLWSDAQATNDATLELFEVEIL